MARGDDNILFNPPVIRKAQAIEPVIGNKRSFPEGTRDVFLLGDRLLVRDDIGMLLNFSFQDKQKENGKDSWWTNTRLKKNKLLSASQDYMIFENDDGFVSEPIGQIGDGGYEKDFPEEDAKALALHAAGKKAYLLWKRKSTNQTFLSETDLNKSGGWREVKEISAEKVDMISKGEKALLIHDGLTANNQKDYRLSTIVENGITEEVRLHKKGPAIEVKSGWSNLITPGKHLDSYWKVAKTIKGDKAVLVFSDKSNDTEKTIPLEGDNYRLLSSSDSRVALLGKRNLYLFSENGKKATYPLTEDYDEMIFQKQRIILWKRNDDSYLEINLENA